MSCGKTGTLTYLESLVSNSRFTIKAHPKSILLPKWKKWEQKYGCLDEIAIVAHRNIKNTKASYFHKRGLGQFIDKGMFGLLDRWAVIPIFDKRKQVIDIVVRAIRQKNIAYVICPYDEQEIRPLYSPDWSRVLKSSQVFVVYGIFDTWAFEAIGKPCVTGITGKYINPTLFDEFGGKNFIIVPDDGEFKNAYKLANELGWRGSVLRINYPHGIKDPDEMKRSMTKADWKQLIQGDQDNATNMVSTITN